MTTGLIGKSDNAVDSKGRVSLPAKYRRLLSGSGLVLAKSLDKEFPCLLLFDEDDFPGWVSSWFEKDGGFQTGNLDHQHKKMSIMQNIEQVKIDDSYRIRIEREMLDYAGIDKQANFVGMVDHVRIMSPELALKVKDVGIYD